MSEQTSQAKFYLVDFKDPEAEIIAYGPYKDAKDAESNVESMGEVVMSDQAPAFKTITNIQMARRAPNEQEEYFIIHFGSPSDKQKPIAFGPYPTEDAAREDVWAAGQDLVLSGESAILDSINNVYQPPRKALDRAEAERNASKPVAKEDTADLDRSEQAMDARREVYRRKAWAVYGILIQDGIINLVDLDAVGDKQERLAHEIHGRITCIEAALEYVDLEYDLL